jgi:acetoin:2,6-dichlorophenolindophenol oxidoreductase subunit alpha
MSTDLSADYASSYRGDTDGERELRLYARMVLIRTFENKLRDLFSKGRLPGFVHLYVGEEAVAVGACSVLRDTDKITSTHRGHGHLIAKGADPRRMMAEIMGKSTGLCRGKGGSMHMADPGLAVAGSNGIVGASIPHAVGFAIAATTLRDGRVAVSFFGDGAVNQGVFHESANLASLWQAPVVFVCENNGYGEFTATDNVTAGTGIAARADAYALRSRIVDGNDVIAVHDAARDALDTARGGGGPTLIECRTLRMRGHHEGEERYASGYRRVDEAATDPITRLASQLEDGDALLQEL